MLPEKRKNFHKGRSLTSTSNTKRAAFPTGLALVTASLTFLTACTQPIAISINNRAVYDPQGRLLENETLDADLQGCINLSLRQQNLSSPSEIMTLSCANSEIQNLDNIGLLSRLRFLDVSGNQITNITPLEALPELSGIYLANNQIAEIGLFNLPSLTSVLLKGNGAIPCTQLRLLQQKLERTFSRQIAAHPRASGGTAMKRNISSERE